VRHVGYLQGSLKNNNLCYYTIRLFNSKRRYSYFKL